MKKLKSYTLLELIVVMALSAVVLLNVIGLYLYVQKHYTLYEEQNKTEIEKIQFIIAFTKDINSANSIYYKENEIEIGLNNDKKMTYTFLKSEIIRTHIRRDTFQLSVIKCKVLMLQESDLVNHIQMDIELGTNTSSFSFFKEYDNSVIVNHEIILSENGN